MRGKSLRLMSGQRTDFNARNSKTPSLHRIPKSKYNLNALTPSNRKINNLSDAEVTTSGINKMRTMKKLLPLSVIQAYSTNDELYKALDKYSELPEANQKENNINKLSDLVSYLKRKEKLGERRNKQNVSIN